MTGIALTMVGMESVVAIEEQASSASRQSGCWAMILPTATVGIVTTQIA
jgi:hypothetical protein